MRIIQIMPHTEAKIALAPAADVADGNVSKIKKILGWGLTDTGEVYPLHIQNSKLIPADTTQLTVVYVQDINDFEVVGG